jgi:hypothetical protein
MRQVINGFRIRWIDLLDIYQAELPLFLILIYLIVVVVVFVVVVIAFIVRSVSFIVCVVVCAVFCLSVVCYLCVASYCSTTATG